MTSTINPTARRRRIAWIVFVLVIGVAAFALRGLLVEWFGGESMGGQAGSEVTTRAGTLKLKAALDPDPPTQKGNTLRLEVRDGDGKPVDDAKVEVSYDMPAMGSMAEMKGGARIEHDGKGRYRARFDLPMSGNWTLKTNVRARTGTAAVDYRLTVGSKGLSASGEGADPAAQMSSDGAVNAGGSGEIDHYTCSMHPSVKQKGPGKCPICGMDLIPVTKQQQQEGVVMIDDARRQLIGVRTARVIEGPMQRTFRAVGRVTYDESTLSDVNLKVRGWITKLFVSKTGQRVQVGQPLFTLYSPELYGAEQDFLLATQGGDTSASATGGPPNRVQLLARAARQRLHLLGLSEAQIDALAKRGAPEENVTIGAPASGFVIEKDVVEGASADPGMRLFRIAALNKVWVEADVYEADLAHVRVGQRVTVTLDYLPDRAYDAAVAYVYPYLDAKARTGRVRVELVNQKLELRPGMYARIELGSAKETRVQVPSSAVVYTGPRRLVFVDLGQGRFRPQEIRVGTEANGMYEVLAGVSPGDVVATSGVFLIAAEARISTAAKYWDDREDSAEGHAPMGSGDATPGSGAHSEMSMPTTSRSKPIRPAPSMQQPGTARPSAASDRPPGSESAAPVYTCPMHPEVQSSTPGTCPKCGMALQLQNNGGSK